MILRKTKGITILAFPRLDPDRRIRMRTLKNSRR
jgi:hypothetical protein